MTVMGLEIPEEARPVARVLLSGPGGRLLLLLGQDASGHQWWVAPGGGLVVGRETLWLAPGQTGASDLATANQPEGWRGRVRADIHVESLDGRPPAAFVATSLEVTRGAAPCSTRGRCRPPLSAE